MSTSDKKQKKPFPFYKQHGQTDCGYACLRMVAEYYGKSYDFTNLDHQKFLTRKGLNLLELTQVLEKMGFRSRSLQGTFDEFKKEPALPCIAYWKQRHFVVVYEITGKTVSIADPASGLKKLSHSDFCEAWEKIDSSEGVKEGIVLTLKPWLFF